MLFMEPIEPSMISWVLTRGRQSAGVLEMGGPCAAGGEDGGGEGVSGQEKARSGSPWWPGGGWGDGEAALATPGFLASRIHH